MPLKSKKTFEKKITTRLEFRFGESQGNAKGTPNRIDEVKKKGTRK